MEMGQKRVYVGSKKRRVFKGQKDAYMQNRRKQQDKPLLLLIGSFQFLAVFLFGGFYGDIPFFLDPVQPDAEIVNGKGG